MRKRSLLVVNMLAIGAVALGMSTLVGPGKAIEQSDQNALREGDLVFQHTGGEQGRATCHRISMDACGYPVQAPWAVDGP